MKRIANQGMTNLETHHTGDLIIRFDVEFPPMNFFTNPILLQVREIQEDLSVHSRCSLQRLEALLPAKPTFNFPSTGTNFDQASPMVDYQKELPSSSKHRSPRTVNEDDDEDDDDQYVDEDEDDEDEDGHPQVHSCQTQ